MTLASKVERKKQSVNNRSSVTYDDSREDTDTDLDDPYIKVPTRLILLLGNFIERNFRTFLIIMSVVIMVVCGIVLAVGTKGGHISVLSLWLFGMGSVGLGIASRIPRISSF
jgi:hypothetical protein